MTMTTSNRQRTRTEVKSELVFIDRSVKVGQFSRWMTHQRPKIGGYHRVGVVWLVVLFCVCQSSVNWSVVCGSWCDSASSYFESVAFHHCRALVGVLFSAAK